MPNAGQLGFAIPWRHDRAFQTMDRPATRQADPGGALRTLAESLD
jgi:hypothetical protein